MGVLNQVRTVQEHRISERRRPRGVTAQRHRERERAKEERKQRTERKWFKALVFKLRCGNVFAPRL